MDVLELVFLRGGQALLHFRVDRAEVCIGSNPTNDVVVPDPSVPDVAAVLIDRGGNRFRLRDLTERTLTVNGQVVEEDECDLDEGSIIGIGPYSLRLELRKHEDVVRPGAGGTNVLTLDSTAHRSAVLYYQGKRHLVSPNAPFNIGSSDDNELVVEDPFVSTFHCRVLQHQGRWIVSDLGSTNGTEVNGVRVREAELPIPATIKVGRSTMRFDLYHPEDEVTTKEATNFHGMIAESDAMRRLFDLVQRVAVSKEPALIIGASGSGKELVARAVHAQSPRANGPYLALNCGALTSTLIESELFGHEKGAFTGASSEKEGAFEACHGGTLFLDEIGELPLELQPKLLRVLESSTIRRVGGIREIPIDTRIVAATHRNLEELVRENRFREDLFHRLFVLSIRIPPLFERAQDILPLARHFVRTHSTRDVRLSPEAEAALLDYTWPGNVRELRNVIVRALLLSDDLAIRADALQLSRDAFTSRSRDARNSVRRIDESERQRLLQALEQAHGNRAEAARIVGLSKSTFHDRLRRLGVPLKFSGRS